MPLRRTFLSCSLCLFFCGVYLDRRGESLQERAGVMCGTERIRRDEGLRVCERGGDTAR